MNWEMQQEVLELRNKMREEIEIILKNTEVAIEDIERRKYEKY